MTQQLSQRQTLEQLRAQQAWRCIDQIKKESKERQEESHGKDKGSLEKEYRSRVRSLNSMIQINGLGPTLGFLKAKSESQNAPYLLLEHLTEWMRERKFILPSSNVEDEESDGEEDSDDAVNSENSMQDIDGAKDATKQAPQMNFEGYDGILNWIIDKATTDEYRRATTECLAFGLWLRRFAEAELASSSPPVSNTNTQQDTETESSASTSTSEAIAASSAEGIEQHG